MSDINTIEQFAERLAQADEPVTDDTENAQPDTEAQNDESQEVSQTEGTEQEEASDEPEGEGDQPATESLDDRVVAWETASGEKFEVPVAELKNGYMRDQDYRHKTQQFAQEREHVTKQLQEQFQTVETYAQDFGALYALNAQVASLEQSIQTIDKNSDPIAYFDAVTQYQMLKEQRNGYASRLQAVQQQQAAQKQQSIAEGQRKMVQELSTSLPGFGAELLNKLNKTAMDYGYSVQELETVTDPRFVKIINDAMQFRSLQAKAPAALNKVKSAPVKPTKQAATPVESDIQKSVKQFSKKKDLNSFAVLLAKTL